MPTGSTIRVLLLDDSINSYDVKPSNYGNVLLQAIMKDLDVLESDYFGAAFVSDGSMTFLDPLRQINRQIKKIDNTVLEFVVKFYTPDPSQLEDEYTRYLLALQIKRDIQTGALPCVESTAVKMASFIAQAEFGDWNPEECSDTSYLEDMKLMEKPTPQHLQTIREQHKKLIGKTPAEADYNLLDVARRLELYGVRLHPALDAQNAKISLGVSHDGVLVFQDNKKINSFNWARIRKLSFKRKRFLIKLRADTAHKGGGIGRILIFVMNSRDACKSFWRLCIEHHAFFRLEVRPKAKPKPVLLSRGSSFYYNGKTQKELVDLVRNSNFRRTTFVRTTSRRRTQNSFSSPTAVIQAKKFRPENNFPTESSNKYLEASLQSKDATPSGSVTSPSGSSYTEDQASYTLGSSSQHSPMQDDGQTTTKAEMSPENDHKSTTPEWQLESKSLHSSATPIEGAEGKQEQQVHAKGKPTLATSSDNTACDVADRNGDRACPDVGNDDTNTNLSYAKKMRFVYKNSHKNDSGVPLVTTLVENVHDERQNSNFNISNNNGFHGAKFQSFNPSATLQSAPPLPPKERQLSGEGSYDNLSDVQGEMQAYASGEHVSSSGFTGIGRTSSKDPFVNDSVVNLASMVTPMTPEVKAKIGEQKIKIGHYSVPKKPPAPPEGEGHVSPLWNRHSQILDNEISEAMTQLYKVINDGSEADVGEDNRLLCGDGSVGIVISSSEDENEYTINGSSVSHELVSPEDDPLLEPIEMEFDDSPNLLLSSI